MSDHFILSCPACGVRNRIPLAKAQATARCGQCTLPLPPACPIPATETSFPDEVLLAPLPVLVDFWAEWCGPCRSLAPSLEAIAREYAGRLKVVKIDTDANRELAKTYGIQSIPTLILFEGGLVKNQIAGALPVQQLRNWLGRSLGWLHPL